MKTKHERIFTLNDPHALRICGSLAQEIGLNESIVLLQLEFLISLPPEKERDGYCCQECGDIKTLGIDHIIPLSKGGEDHLDNLRWLCRRCNSKKGDKQ